MSRLDDLAERIERLVLRHEELQRTNALLQTQLGMVTGERDSLLDRLPAEPVAAATPAVARKTDAA
jgi:cell division protein ZapB